MKGGSAMKCVSLAVLTAVLGVSAFGAGRPHYIAYRSFMKELEETAAFAKMGIPLRAFGVCNTLNGLGTPYSAYPAAWLGYGKYDWAVVDREIDDILAHSPDAELICLVDLNTPPWMARDIRFDSFDNVSHAAAIPKWRRETKAWMNALIDRCERKCGSRVRSYVLMAGHTTEWIEECPTVTSRWKNEAWRKWCAARGADHGPSTPDESELARAAFEGVIYDPATERAKIDYWTFNNELVGDALLEFAHDAKRSAHGKEIGAFFGYLFICSKRFASVSHLDFERVAASDDVDYFISPGTYTRRGIGNGAGTMTSPGTLRAHGKRFFHEVDFWPHSLNPPWKKYWHSLAETLAGNTREVAYAIVNHASYWHFDMWGGFYCDPGVHERLARLAEVARRFADDTSPLEADVLIAGDPQSACWAVDVTTSDTPEKGGAMCPDGFAPLRACGEMLRLPLRNSGLSVDLCAVDDLARLDLSKVKLLLMPGTWVITPEREKMLREKVCRDGRTVLWTYAPGVGDGRTLDPARVKRWAGVEFKHREIVRTDMGGWVSVYAYDWRKLTDAKLREIAKAAGCHFWTDEPTPVIANERLLSVHCATGGVKRINLKRTCAKVVELVSGRTVAEKTDRFDFTFDTPDTRLFEMVSDSAE